MSDMVAGAMATGFLGLNRQVEIAVDVRHAAEIPDHVRALDLPDIPHLVIADIEFAQKSGHICWRIHKDLKPGDWNHRNPNDTAVAATRIWERRKRKRLKRGI